MVEVTSDRKDITTVTTNQCHWEPERSVCVKKSTFKNETLLFTNSKQHSHHVFHMSLVSVRLTLKPIMLAELPQSVDRFGNAA